MPTHTQRTSRPFSPDKTERGPGKTNGANISGTAGKFTSRSGRKSEEELDAKNTTVVSSANKQPGSRSPNGAGGATHPAGTARKGNRITAARKSREAIH